MSFHDSFLILFSLFAFTEQIINLHKVRICYSLSDGNNRNLVNVNFLMFRNKAEMNGMQGCRVAKLTTRHSSYLSLMKVDFL